MTAKGAPVSQRESDIYEVAGLPSWTPQTSSAFPPAWTAPPRSGGHRTTFAVGGGAAIAAAALCAALVIWPRMADQAPPAATAPAQVGVAAHATPVAADVAPVAADVVPLWADAAPVAADVARVVADVAVAMDVAPVAADVAPVAADVAPVAADVAPVAAQLAVAAVQVAPTAEADAVQTAPSVAAVAAATLVEQRPGATDVGATELEPPAIAAAVDPRPLDVDAALLALAAESVEVAEAQEAQTTAASAAELPEVPTRESVVAAIDGVRPAVQVCAAQRHGRVPVLLTVASDGRVRSATVSGGFAGTPEGSCIARAVRGARFPAFAQERLEITYPFVL